MKQEQWKLYYSEAIGQNPVDPRSFTEPYHVATGTKEECREFAEQWNWIRAVWEIRPVDEKSSEVEVVFFNSLRPQVSTKPKNEAGFTLIEMMIAMGITLAIIGFGLIAYGLYYLHHLIK